MKKEIVKEQREKHRKMIRAISLYLESQNVAPGHYKLSFNIFVPNEPREYIYTRERLKPVSEKEFHEYEVPSLP